MNTKLIKIDEVNISIEELEEASQILKAGGLVAFPTETVYGLGADGLNADASRKIYAAKGRPSDNPLILHIAELEDLKEIAVNIPENGFKLAKAFWPGPLTLIFEKSEKVPFSTTGGLSTVAVRMPSHKIAQELIKQSGVYIAAPSANVSGRPSPTTAEHVLEDLDGVIEMVIDGGKVDIGLESTIVDVTADKPIILRPGYITEDMLSQVVGEIEYDKVVLARSSQNDFIPKAPGMKYRHYSPKGELVIYEGDTNQVIKTINQAAGEKILQGYKVGIIATEETRSFYQEGIVKTIGTRRDDNTIARGLFEVLRAFDTEGCEYIFTESFDNNQLGQAIMNRLLKAAGYHIEKV